jgi:FMN phosphatase YigB (HAD superfamily)
MHHKYGSTIRGICENGAPKDPTVMDYYNEVYPNLDMSKLRKFSQSLDQMSTGYEAEVNEALKSIMKLDCPVVIASNSPVFHVKRVLSRLGLSKLQVAAYLTPERRGGYTKTDEKFWYPLLKLFPTSKFRCTLIDDNGMNIKLVRKLGIYGYHITPHFSLSDALVHFLDVIPHCRSVYDTNIHQIGEKDDMRMKDASWLNYDALKFEDNLYLRAKNEV